MLVESTGGPTWYSEYNLLTGLSARSYGKLMYYVTRIAADRVTRGLPNALARCGYQTFSLYPAMGDFLSARRFQTGVGIRNFIDQHGMGADVEMHPDSFFYDQTLQLFARERSEAPLFVFTYLTANHFPWTETYRTDLTPDWKAPGNTPEIDEYLRRQMMSAQRLRGICPKAEARVSERTISDHSFRRSPAGHFEQVARTQREAERHRAPDHAVRSEIFHDSLCDRCDQFRAGRSVLRPGSCLKDPICR